MKRKSKKKDKPLYDENGRWVEERGRIKGAVRRAFRLSPQMRETTQAARVELPPALKKDGTPGKRPQVRYKCAICGKLFSQKQINVDHVECVIPLWKKESTMSYDEVVRGVFCDKKNLQVVCSMAMKYNDGKPSCHKKKTDEENFIRRKWEAFAIKEGTDAEGFEWSMDKSSHKEWVLKQHNLWKLEFKKYLIQKEENARKRKSKKRARDLKRNSSNKK